MHRPFSVLAERFSTEGSVHPDDAKPAPPCIRDTAARGLSEVDLFLATVGEVRRVRSRELRSSSPVVIEAGADDPDRDRRALEDACRDPTIDLTARREYAESWGVPEGRLYVEDLRQGRFAIEAHIDLHGLSRSQARDRLEAFIRESVRLGRRCVRVVHGRGRHSPGGRPLLKESVERWLGQRRVGRFVLAFTSARMVDGGGGAVYVLLKARGRIDHGLRF